MEKIPTLFVRDEHDRRYVTPEVTPGCEWVLAGEGVPTRKFDGTCVMFDGTRWWARREVKAGKEAPADFVELAMDETTGKSVGWEPVESSGFARWALEAIDNLDDSRAGTYELVGPKVNGNPEGYQDHRLVLHEDAQPLGRPHEPTFGSLREYLTSPDFTYEGIVWHHSDGRMAKLKKRDFPRAQR